MKQSSYIDAEVATNHAFYHNLSKTGDWAELTEQFVKSYESLDKVSYLVYCRSGSCSYRYSRF